MFVDTSAMWSIRVRLPTVCRRSNVLCIGSSVKIRRHVTVTVRRICQKSNHVREEVIGGRVRSTGSQSQQSRSAQSLIKRSRIEHWSSTRWCADRENTAWKRQWSSPFIENRRRSSVSQYVVSSCIEIAEGDPDSSAELIDIIKKKIIAAARCDSRSSQCSCASWVR